MDGILAFSTSTTSSSSARLKIPFLPPFELTNNTVAFTDYPRFFRLQDSDGNPSVARARAAELPAFLQTWLFFGLLSEFLQQRIDPFDFVVHGAIDIHRDESHAYFTKWAAEVEKLGKAQKEAELDRIVAILELSSFYVDVYDCFSYESDILDRVALSIKLLVSLLLRIAEETCTPMTAPEGPTPSVSWVGYAVNGFGLTARNDRMSRIMRTGRREARNHLARATREFKPLQANFQHDGGSKVCRATRFLLTIFAARGWCPHKASHICLSYDYLIANTFAASIEPGSVVDASRHLPCFDDAKCVAFNVPEGPYPFWHVDNDDCSPVKVPRAEISSIIDEGGIPIISIDAHADDLDLKVIECNTWTTYTAVSHVWSDGLGNPEENSLFRCQLYRLRAMIRECFDPEYSPFFNYEGSGPRWRKWLRWYFHNLHLPGKPLRSRDKGRICFWIDTLCIPVTNRGDDDATRKNMRRLKEKAIKQITPIYAGASEALVLDRGLEALEAPAAAPIPPFECALHVLSSTWAQRGWTLEEGSISQSCVFRIANRPYDMDLLTDDTPFNKVPAYITSPLWKVWWNFRKALPVILGRELGEEKKRLTTMRELGRGYVEDCLRIPHFVRVWNSLIARSTTREEDSVIILTNLLDFNVSRVLQTGEDDRLPLVIKSCAEIPVSLMYAVDRRRSVSHPLENSWIPLQVSSPTVVGGAYWKATKHSDKLGNYSLDFEDCLPHQFLVFITDSLVSRETPVFSLEHNGKTLYVKSKPHAPGQTPGRTNNGVQRSLVLVDLAAGSNGLGFIGMGAKFEVLSISPQEVVVSFESSTEVYSTDQWRLNATDLQHPTEYFASKKLAEKQTVYLRIDEPNLVPGVERLRRRPMLTQHPFGATVLAGFFVAIFVAVAFAFIALRMLSGFFDWAWRSWPVLMRRVLFPYISTTIIVLLSRVFFHIIHQPVRRRLSMYAYHRWLRTFSDEFSRPRARWHTRFRRKISTAMTGVQRLRIFNRRQRAESLEPVPLLTQTEDSDGN